MDSTAAKPSQRRFSIAQLALLVPWVALVIDAWGKIGDNSFLWHIRAGSVQADAAEVLTADPFSFTRRGETWLTQSWLAELVYAWLESLSGLDFVPWMILATGTLTFLGIGLIAYHISGNETGTAFVMILSVLALISFMVPRPVLFSYLLFVLVILAWGREGTRWTIPFLMWVWASVHGSFVIGLVYLALMVIVRREWKALTIPVVGGLTTLTTPHGLGVLGILLDFATAREALSFLTEWREPTFEAPAFLALMGGMAMIVIGAYRQKVTLNHLWVIVPFLILAFTSLRAVPPAWLGLAPVVALALKDMELGTKARFGVISAVVFTLVVLVIPAPLAEDAVIDDERFPVAAAEHLVDVPTFHDDRVGGYLIWAEWPDRLVYLDDRAELYLDRIGEFVRVRSGQEDWRGVFDRDEIEQALLLRSEKLVGELSAAGWESVYQDENYVVLRP